MNSKRGRVPMPYRMRNPERFAKISAMFLTTDAKRRLDAERDRRSQTRITPYTIAELVDEAVIQYYPEAPPLPVVPDPPKRKPAQRQRQRRDRAQSAAG